MDVGRHMATPACSTAEKCVENENTEEAENIGEPENVADIEGSVNASIDADSTAEKCVENENTEEAENIGEPENVADIEGSVNASIAADCMLYSDVISLKRQKSDSEDSVHDDAVNNAKRRKHAHSETIDKSLTGNNAENISTEETERDVHTENITYKESPENSMTKIETLTGNNAEIESTEETERDAHTEHIAYKESPEYSMTTIERNCILAITDNDNSDEIENNPETDNDAQNGGSTTAIIPEERPVARGIDMCTSTREENKMPRGGGYRRRLHVPARASFNYDSLISNTWQEVPIQISTTAQAQVFQKSTIDVFTAESYLDEGSILRKFQFPVAGKELFYHGTTIKSAKSIIEKGIDLTVSSRPLDFSCGKGFYVTNSYEKAVQWSKSKAKRCSSTGAVIAFKIGIRNERHLSLDVDSQTNRKFWECIVSHFRHCKTSPDVTRVLRDVKYIEGPVAKGIRRIDQGQLPTPTDSGRFHQLCICDQGYANTFGHLDNILCVIWFKYR